MFAFLFKNSNDDHTRNSFDKYYMLLVEIKDFNGYNWQQTIFWSASPKQTTSAGKKHRNVKK